MNSSVLADYQIDQMFTDHHRFDPSSIRNYDTHINFICVSSIQKLPEWSMAKYLMAITCLQSY